MVEVLNSHHPQKRALALIFGNKQPPSKMSVSAHFQWWWGEGGAGNFSVSSKIKEKDNIAVHLGYSTCNCPNVRSVIVLSLASESPVRNIRTFAGQRKSGP